MTLSIVMRTASRRGGPDYLTRTLRQIAGQRVPPSQVHLFPTAPDVRMTPEARGACTVHAPDRAYRATENMGVALLGAPPCDWVLHLEDDVKPCRDLIGSVTRWLSMHAREDVRLVSFFTPSIKAVTMREAHASGVSALAFPITRWTSAVAFAMRWADAQACGRWILDHADTWRVGPDYPEWANARGADRMVGAWHEATYPHITEALTSVPCLVEHIGHISTLRGLGRFGFVKAPLFVGQAWNRA